MTVQRLGVALKREGYAPADIYFDDTGNLAMVSNTEAIGQHARQRLMTHTGEWFLDKDAGVPWTSEVLGFRYDPVLAEAVFKAVLWDTDGVTEVTTFSARFDRETRNLSMYNIEVLTEYDEEVAV